MNRRQLDIQAHAPRSMVVLDARIQAEVQRHLNRGRVSGEVSVSWSSSARKKSIQVDHDLAESYVAEIRKAAQRLGLHEDLSSSMLLSLPKVVTYREPSQDMEKVWGVMEKALRTALRGLVRMRVREGRELQRDIQSRLDKLSRSVGRIQKHAPEVTRQHRKTLLKRIKDSGVSIPLDDERLLRELAFFADRSDVTEELTRLDSHLKQCQKLMCSREAAGRALDFLAQEMFREINTIGSKANDADILRHVVSFKTELERVREQIQNVE